MRVEIRSLREEIRSAGGRTLAGLAAVFNTPTTIGAGASRFRETVLPGAFARHLATGRPVLMLAHHDVTQPIARTGEGGTMSLHETARGLAFEAVLPETRAGDMVLEQVRAGLISGCSFAFRVSPGGETWPKPDERELRSLDLIEVSPVTIPQYAGTSIAARSVTFPRWRLLLDAL